MENNLKKMKRPTEYTDELADKICIQILTSTKSLKGICKNTDFPAQRTVYQWLNNNEHKDFLAKYQLACDIQIDLLADKIIAIADNTTNDVIQRNREGETIPNSAQVQKDRIRMDNLKRKTSELVHKGTKPFG